MLEETDRVYFILNKESGLVMRNSFVKYLESGAIEFGFDLAPYQAEFIKKVLADPDVTLTIAPQKHIIVVETDMDEVELVQYLKDHVSSSQKPTRGPFRIPPPEGE